MRTVTPGQRRPFRRSEATGGYIQLLPSGSFRVSVYAGTDPLTGRQIRLRKTCKTERAAQIELGKLLEQAEAGRQPETNAIVAELMDRYAEVADWDLSTRKANEVYIRRVIKPALGHLEVREAPRAPARPPVRAAEAVQRSALHREAAHRAPERAAPGCRPG
jgi:integrase